MRVFLASTGQGMSRETRDEAFRKYQPRYVLETFFNGEKACLKAMQAVGNDNFLLDSGAFSYMNGQKVTLEQMEEYVNSYIDFIVKYKVKYFRIIKGRRMAPEDGTDNRQTVHTCLA